MFYSTYIFFKKMFNNMNNVTFTQIVYYYDL